VRPPLNVRWLGRVAYRDAWALQRELAAQRADDAYRARLAEGSGLRVLDLPELVRRRFDLPALEVLAVALAEAVAPNGRP
jgi:hypothetical protein